MYLLTDTQSCKHAQAIYLYMGCQRNKIFQNQKQTYKGNFAFTGAWYNIFWNSDWYNKNVQPIPVAARSKAQVYGHSPAAIVGSNPTGGMDVCCVCCVLLGRGLYDGLTTRPEESYRLWRVVVYDQETSYARRLQPRQRAAKYKPTMRCTVSRKKSQCTQRPKIDDNSLKLCTDRPPRTLVESDSTICCMHTIVPS